MCVCVFVSVNDQRKKEWDRPAVVSRDSGLSESMSLHTSVAAAECITIFSMSSGQ